MIRAWTKRVLVGCFLAGPIACVLSTGDEGPIDDDIVGTSGSGNASGSGGSGTSGSSGTGGSSAGGSAGSLSMVENGGSGGSTQVSTPVCTAEAGDATDACLSCIKAQCCTQWQACNDEGCQTEREDTLDCVRMMEAPDAETFGACLSASSFDMSDLPQENTVNLFDCVTELSPDPDAGGGTRCGTQCFGTDIFLE
jgi:hypothetical protein